MSQLLLPATFWVSECRQVPCWDIRNSSQCWYFMAFRQPLTPLCFLLHSFIAPSACVWFTSTLILPCARVCCVQMLQDWTVVAFREQLFCFWFGIYNPSGGIIFSKLLNESSTLQDCVCFAQQMCVGVCAVFVVLLGLLRVSNGFHSPPFSPHGVTRAPPPPSPHFHHLPPPPPLPLCLLLTTAAWGSSLLKNGWIIIQASPLTGASR